jgi:hypothetical protein
LICVPPVSLLSEPVQATLAHAIQSLKISSAKRTANREAMFCRGVLLSAAKNLPR